MTGSKVVGGIHLPATETHLEEHMLGTARRFVDGRATYQLKKLERALQLLPAHRRGLAVDIGAHCGLWSMHMAKHFRHIEAFEPVPLHRELYRLNLSSVEIVGEKDGRRIINRPSYRLHPVALGEKEGRVDIQIPLETSGNAHVAIAGRHPGTKGVEHPERQYTVHGVPLKTLDSFGLTGVDFIKIDVEGLERAVVQGAEQTIRACRPLIVVEQKGNDSAYGDEPEAAAKLLLSWGLKRLDVVSGDWIMQ